jgi:aspartokinase
MIKVSDTVYEILQGSETALESMRLGILNLRAYARQIQPQVEEKTYKPVKIGTIVVALFRLSKTLSDIEPMQPQIILEELSIKSPLSDITFENTRENARLAHTFSKLLENMDGYFFTITQGVDEITFVVSDSLKPKLLRHFAHKPKSIFENLVGVNVRFGEQYLSQPNVIYAILAKLAAKRINVIEIVSTYTELMVVIENSEMEAAVMELNKLFKK